MRDSYCAGCGEAAVFRSNGNGGSALTDGSDNAVGANGCNAFVTGSVSYVLIGGVRRDESSSQCLCLALFKRYTGRRGGDAGCGSGTGNGN